MELSVSVTQQIITSLDSSMETPVQKQSLPPALLTFSTCKFEYVWIAEKLWQSWHALLMHFHNPVPRLCQLALPWVKVLKDNDIRQSPSTFWKKRQWVSSSTCLVLLFDYICFALTPVQPFQYWSVLHLHWPLNTCPLWSFRRPRPV